MSQNVGDEAGVAGVGVVLVLSREKTPPLRHALGEAGAGEGGDVGVGEVGRVDEVAVGSL